MNKFAINIKKMDSKYLDMICDYLNKSFGIFVEESKKDLLSQKLAKLMEDDEVETAAEYYHFIVAPPISERHKKIRNNFVDNVTVHKTNFFRENHHFEFIKKNIDKIIQESPRIQQTKEVRVWSSACSTGEEPYTLAMVFKEILPPGYRVKILGTDISPQSIRKALEGVYKFSIEDNLTSFYINKYFTHDGQYHRVTDDIRQSVTFRLFNLMEQFPFSNPFDIIFCRNVMIYFNRETQEKLVNNFYEHLAESGLLFIGHSESLIQIKHSFNYYEPTIYKKSWNKNVKKNNTL
jgi:chemotaxis protein methyltransferase CheR